MNNFLKVMYHNIVTLIIFYTKKYFFIDSYDESFVKIYYFNILTSSQHNAYILTFYTYINKND